MKKSEFKAQIHTMTLEQKKSFSDIHTNLVSDVNDREFKTRGGYRVAMRKTYTEAIAEYLKTVNPTNKVIYLVKVGNSIIEQSYSLEVAKQTLKDYNFDAPSFVTKAKLYKATLK